MPQHHLWSGSRAARCLPGLCLAWALFTPSAPAAETTNPSDHVLLLDKVGNPVQVPTNQVPPGLLPPERIGVRGQLPQPTPGAPQPAEVRERTQAAAQPFRLFPSIAPPLMPYLASQDEYGNTVASPGPLIPLFPFEPWIQGAKYGLSDHGLRYSLEQTVTFVSLTDVAQGSHSLDFYTLDFKSKWALFSSPGGAPAGWLSAQIEAKSGLDAPGQTQNAGGNLGTITDPTGIWSSINGIRFPELAWQQSLRDGELVVLVGMPNQDNYLDQNLYAQSGRRTFNNSALIDNMVLPLTKGHFGFNLQWQPVSTWYAMLGGAAGNAPDGQAPWTDFSFRTWSLLGELGYCPSNGFGLGPGIYRLQPFVGQAKSPTEAGLCFDLQQRLGQHSPFGWFGRFGFGGEHVAKGATPQVSTGLVLHAPLKQLRLAPRLTNDLLGLGLIWSQPSATTKTVVHENEYVLETFYSLQLSPTVRLMPNAQVVWNPGFNARHDTAAAFQLQLVLAW